MSKRNLSLLLADMLESANKIKRYTETIDYQAFIKDDKTTDAVVRNFEVIGEAANRLDPGFRADNTNIPWNRIRGFRNRIVHDYFGIDHEIVWAIIQNDLDELINNLSKLIQNK